MENKMKEIRMEWEKLFKHPPPPHAHYDFMRGHVAWIKQTKKHSGLKRTTQTTLQKLMKQLREEGDIAPDNALIIKPGTRLVRQYKGTRYEVIATHEGFLYQGKEYKSLSMIAREITGTRWNGKLFFGVKKS